MFVKPLLLPARRFVDTDAYKHWKKTGSLRYTEFGTDSSMLKDAINAFSFLLGQGSGKLGCRVGSPWAAPALPL